MSCSLDELSAKNKAALVRDILLKKQGLLDDDWSELCSRYDLNINADTLRKAGVGVKLAADAEASSPKPNDISAGYIDRQKMRDLTKNVNSLFRTESRSELLRETVTEAVKSLPRFDITTSIPRTDGNKSLVLMLGDFHYGADIHVKGLLGETLNQFDSDVFENRMGKLLEETLAILDKENLSSVHVLLVGDLIDGMLRQSQLMRLQYGMVESTIRLSEYLATWLAALADHASVRVFAAMGNHSEVRPLKAAAREFEEENLEKIIMWYLAARFAGEDNVYINPECNVSQFVKIEGYDFLLLHGDGEKAIDKLAQSSVNIYGKPIDFFVCGHRHKEQEYPMGLTDGGSSIIIRVPSICGLDKYAQSKGYGGLPGATAMVIERGYGRRCMYPIRLD